MGEATAHIEQHIYEKRHELDEHIHELQHKAKDAVDWRVQVNERPWTVMGIAFAAGIIAAFVANTSGSNHGSQRGSQQDDRTSRMWSNLKSAAGVAILTKAKEFGEDVIPGFREEYRKSEAHGTTQSDASVPYA